MGLRSWLTPVSTVKEFEQVLHSVEENPDAYGIDYIVKIEVPGVSFQPGEFVVAWSGDGSWSKNELKPARCRAKTLLLDNFVDEYPEWHSEPGGPAKFGRMFTSAEEVKQAMADSDADPKAVGE